MKELYTSPEMKLVCFAPAEKIAKNFVNFDDLSLGTFDTNETYTGISGQGNDLDVNAAMDDAMD